MTFRPDDRTPVERAEYYATLVSRLCKEKGIGNKPAIEEISKETGRCTRTIQRDVQFTNALRSLPLEMQRGIRTGVIKTSLSSVIALAASPQRTRETVWDTIQRKGISLKNALDRSAEWCKAPCKTTRSKRQKFYQLPQPRSVENLTKDCNVKLIDLRQAIKDLYAERVSQRGRGELEGLVNKIEEKLKVL